MFSNIDDSTQTMDAIINYIMAGQGKFSGADDWQEFLEIIRENVQLEHNLIGKKRFL